MAFVFTKYLVPYVEPLSIVFSRTLIGVIVMFFILKRRGLSLRVSLNVIPWFLFFGFMGVFMHQWVQAYALYTSKASTATWIIATAPVFIAILSRFLLKERFSFLKTLGVLFSFIGVLVVVTEGDLFLVFKQGIRTIGDIIILATSVNWALFSVISRAFLKKHKSIPQIVVIFYNALWGLVLAGFTFIFVGRVGDFLVVVSDFKLLISTLFLGVLCTGFAHAFWYDALDVMEASKVGIFMNLQPIVGMISASLILGEPLSFALLFGGTLILTGVYLVNRF
ncbi:MAG: hypothetical protein PWQ16_1094 [bacterium]|nr:hypothetical protein [bacterium]